MSTSHPEPDDLTLAALPAEQRDPSVAAHLAWCTSCREQVDELTRTVGLAQDGMVEPPSDLLPAPERVWQAIAAELGPELGGAGPSGPRWDGLATGGSEPGRTDRDGSGPDGAGPNGAGPNGAGPDAPARGEVAGPAGAARRGSGGPRRRWRVLVAAFIAAVALAAGVGIGLGVSTAVGRKPGSTVIARLAPVDAANPGGAGTLSAVERDGVRTMVVHLTGVSDTEGADFLEVWLMNQAGTQIVALGALTREGATWDGSFTVPANLPMGQLDVVDVSAERFDGDAGHSGVSLLRGPVS